MSRRSYPYYDGRRKIKPAPNPPKKCAVPHCEDAATYRVEVQFTWFRSDDGTVDVCEPHAKKAMDDVDGLCENVPQQAWK